MTGIDIPARIARLEGTVERRIALRDVEFRKVGANTRSFTGYAALFDEPYDMYGGASEGGWSEVVDPDAFTRTLNSGPDVVLLLNHDGLPLARTTAGTLSLAADKIGLRVGAPELDTRDPDVQRLAVKMDRGDLDGQMSFAFFTKRQQWSPDYDERRLLELDLNHGDVSIVNFGAQPKTSAQLRSLLAGIATPAEVRAIEARLQARDASVDPDEDAGMIAQGIDAAIDAAVKCLTPDDDDYNPEQALALLVAAEISSDALLALLGVPDADDARALARSPEERTPSTRMTVARARRLMLLDE